MVGPNAPLIKELAELWMNSGNNEKIASHDAQKLFAEEIRAQLIFWADYAKQTGKMYIAGVYKRAALMLEHNLKVKEQQKEQHTQEPIPQNLQEDRVFKTIQDYLKEIH